MRSSGGEVAVNPIARGELAVRDLHVRTVDGGRPLLDGISCFASTGEALGVVGESGSGKSLLLRTIIGMLPRGVRISAGSVALGGRVGMVFQDPMTALDPLASVGSQIAEAARFGGGAGRSEARRQAIRLMTDVKLPDPQRRYRWYPHQLSGGQRQRVVIAMALATRPDLLLCDEPTTALDVTVQATLLRLLADEQHKRGMTMVFVSHNLAVVHRVCSRIIVLRAGRVVESGTAERIVRSPHDPYTKRLLASVLSTNYSGVA